MSKRGREAVLQHVTQKIIDEIKKVIRDAGQFACAKIDKVLAEMKHKGAKLPDMKHWSCDQKIGFVAAMGPEGVACIVAGALVGGLANDCANQVKRYAKDAEKAANSIAAKSGVTAAASAVGNAATNAAHKLGL